MVLKTCCNCCTLDDHECAKSTMCPIVDCTCTAAKWLAGNQSVK